MTRSLIGRAAEGQPRGGPWLLPYSGGWLPSGVGDSWNWWQQGYNVESYAPSALVEACVSAYSQTVAMCPGDHWVTHENGGRERITNSALSRILRRPNGYDSISDFMLNSTRSLYINGNAYALALRNSRYEITELHLMDPRQCCAWVTETGEVFYQLNGNEIVRRLLAGAAEEYPLFVPQRDVLHVRLHVPPRNSVTTSNILRGESPLIAVARDLAMTDAIVAQQLQFYQNQARPSAVLTTEMVLDKDQVNLLRERWDEQSKGLGRGGTPILTAGLKPQQLAFTAEDSQLVDVMKMTEQRIALAYRIPLQILGLGSTMQGSTEVLMQTWIASGLGFALNHIEEAWGKLFELDGQPDEYVEFDTSALLRSAFKDRIDAFVRGVQGGILSPNEARAQEGYKPVKYGDEPRVQQQVVPLSAASGIPSAPGPGSAPPAPPAAGPQPGARDTAPSDETRGMNDAERENLLRRLRSSHARSLSL
jgi:HK97 family phage portal protein